MENRNKEIAAEILNQLGGYGKLKAMVNVKDVYTIDNGIHFKICSGHIIEIKLNSLDLYDVTIGKLIKYDFKLIKSMSDVYVDMLKDIIENTCKVRLSL